MIQQTTEIGGEFVKPGTDYLDAILGVLTDPMGEALFGLFIACFVFFVLYYASGGRIGVPAVVMTMAGGWLVTEIPVQYRGAIAVLIIVGLSAGVFAIARRYFLRPSA